MSGLDTAKIENPRKDAHGRIIARCPACASRGGDRNSEHLVIFPGGRFACAAFAGDHQHRQEIWKFAGAPAGRRRRPPPVAIKSPPDPISHTLRTLDFHPRVCARERESDKEIYSKASEVYEPREADDGFPAVIEYPEEDLYIVKVSPTQTFITHDPKYLRVGFTSEI